MSYSKEWISILNEVAEFQKNKSYTWFRGQNKESDNLNSGIFRVKMSDKKSYTSTELYYYSQFYRVGYIHHREDDDWNLLFLMQHHGVRTRLLDWTESFLVALYFANENWVTKETAAAIWLLDPLQLNELTLNERMYYLPKEKYYDYISNKIEFNKNTLALFPIRNNSRIVTQQGVFTLQGQCGEPLEDEFEGQLIKKNILKKIVLKAELKKDIELYLKQSGISDFSLFPDLDGLSKYINKQGYFHPRK